ncbi:MAG: valine--tRNA ligase [bacterium]|nr:valine--tRNA ligase [bacterium]
MSHNIRLEKVYDPQQVESETYALWRRESAFDAERDDRPADRRFVIWIPLPNVTGALHLGHAINNSLQDILIRWHRMQGDNTLWQPGVDHAGIATQAVVEKRILEEEGLNRHDLGREKLVERIWQWKDQYQKRIVGQLQQMGCSCDWRRMRFTLDEVCAKAVRHAFFRMFKDGLIYRGKRLVNWDTQLQTAVADDEVYHESIRGHFWHFKYPVIDPQPGEPECVHIATTRPETMLGDTAVAVHPDPAAFFEKRVRELRDKCGVASDKEHREINAQLEALAQRRETHLELLLKLRDMAAAGRQVMLPLVQRPIPLIQDEWADPTKGSGCVKITPAHDPNDYEAGLRHHLPMVNVLSADGKIAPIIEPDGTQNPHSNTYAGLGFIDKGRDKVVADLEAAGLLEKIEDHVMDVGHSDRSKKRIEPYLSDQWFLRMGDVEGGVPLADGTRAPGLAQAAMDAVIDGRVRVFPERYDKTYLDWLGEKRDWCISRQLWWGHQIQVWTIPEVDRPDASSTAIANIKAQLGQWESNGRIALAPGAEWGGALPPLVCVRDPEGEDQDIVEWLEQNRWRRDPDVLDTWFSSSLWPFSTLGWPDEEMSKKLGLDYYYPGSVLITSRDIITLWVARMVLMGLYNIGDIPFQHTYIHAKILDGRGEGMSKSKGNGVDPLDIIEVYGTDALRYTLADMTTETQDVRMPVEYRCPHCQGLTPQTAGNMRAKTLECKPCGKTFATQWADEGTQTEHGRALMVSDKFEIGRNFCNKLWNAARFAFMNLEGVVHQPLDIATLPLEDRWILAQLDQTIVEAQDALREYRYSASINRLREFFWDSLCDWYIELAKPRMSEPPPHDALGGQGAEDAPSRDRKGAEARQVLAFCLDQILRLLSPFIPFITERLWKQLNELAPQRGLPGVAELACGEVLMLAEYPPAEGWPALRDPAVLQACADIQSVTRGVREMRNTNRVPPKQAATVTVKAPADHVRALTEHMHIIKELANVADLQVVTEFRRPPNAASALLGGLQIYVHDISDDQAEHQRITKNLEEVGRLLEGSRKKLANEKFVNNAKPEIVQGERDRLTDLEARREGLLNGLAELSG